MPSGQHPKSLGPLAIAGVDPYQEEAGETYMNPRQLAHFRKILEAWRTSCVVVDRTVGYMKDEAANFPDPVDRAVQEEEFALELRTETEKRKLIKKIEKTLQNLMMNMANLATANIAVLKSASSVSKLSPTAELCIDCKTIAEIVRKAVENG